MSFSTKTAPTVTRSRFTLDAKRSAPLFREGERVSAGIDPKDGAEHLVWTFGAQSSAVPMYAVATAICTGTVVPMDDLAAAIVEAGAGSKLATALKKATDAATKAAGA